MSILLSAIFVVCGVQVVVSISETDEPTAAALEDSLRAVLTTGNASACGESPPSQGQGPASSSSAGDHAWIRAWPSVRVVSTTAKRSHAMNNNAAAAMCGADVVSWFDADDRMHPRRTEVKPFNVAVVW